MHRPGIEPGAIGWQPIILPLNQRCMGYVMMQCLVQGEGLFLGDLFTDRHK